MLPAKPRSDKVTSLLRVPFRATVAPMRISGAMGQIEPMSVNQLKDACTQMGRSWDEKTGQCMDQQIPSWLPWALAGFGVIMLTGFAVQAWRVAKGLPEPGMGTFIIGGRR